MYVGCVCEDDEKAAAKPVGSDSQDTAGSEDSEEWGGDMDSDTFSDGGDAVETAGRVAEGAKSMFDYFFK